MRATEDPWHADIGMEMETLHDGKNTMRVLHPATRIPPKTAGFQR